MKELAELINERRPEGLDPVVLGELQYTRSAQSSLYPEMKDPSGG